MTKHNHLEEYNNEYSSVIPWSIAGVAIACCGCMLILLVILVIYIILNGYHTNLFPSRAF